MKKILLILLAFIIIFSAIGCSLKNNNKKDTLGYFKSLKSYSADMDIEVKNDKQNLNYSGRQIYSLGLGYRLELNKERVLIYKEDKIYVTDLNNGQKYVTDMNFDDVYKISFLGKFIDLLYTNETIKTSFKTIDNDQYELINTTMPDSNRNISYGVLYVSIDKKIPKKLIIYDNKGKEKVIITYKNFIPNCNVDKTLF
ncbi:MULTISPECIES: germination lipoprotein GerS-related protein [Clostridium]|uniref:germination lipoprotein GerS-related protein n=1 Tax=Clostridium TaxID=1485 RepID=UPI000289B20E|nr:MULTISPECIES: germination lipoprotein GerS-related protein [Clostridium]